MEYLQENKVEYKIESDWDSPESAVIRFNVKQIKFLEERVKLCEKILISWEISAADFSKNKIAIFEVTATEGMYKGRKAILINELLTNRLNSLGFQVLFRYFAQKSLKLLSLNISGNNLNDSQICKLAEALMINDSIKFLSLRNNNFTTASARAIAIMLRYNKTLISLDLHNNNLRLPAISEIAGGIRVNRTLQTIDIGDKNLSNLSRVKPTIKVIRFSTSMKDLKYV